VGKRWNGDSNKRRWAGGLFHFGNEWLLSFGNLWVRMKASRAGDVGWRYWTEVRRRGMPGWQGGKIFENWSGCSAPDSDNTGSRASS